jgi:hypothetical protein
MGATACSGAEDAAEFDAAAAPEAEALSSGDAQQLIEEVRSLGFESDIELAGDRFIVDGDMEVDGATLRGLAVDAAARRGDPELLEKGYFISSSVIPGSRAEPRFGIRSPKASAIRLNFDSSVSADWRAAVLQAAAEWNDACINMQDGVGTETINVTIDPTLGVDTLGRAELSRVVTVLGSRVAAGSVTAVPGTRLLLNSAPLSAAEMFHVALHELGHNLGFTHPTEGAVIPTTLSDGTSGNDVSYNTIMAPVITSPPLTGLQGDDLHARSAVFSKITKTRPDSSGRGTVSFQACPDGTDIVFF